MSRYTAAVKLQAMQRGRAARAQVKGMRDQGAADTEEEEEDGDGGADYEDVDLLSSFTPAVPASVLEAQGGVVHVELS